MAIASLRKLDKALSAKLNGITRDQIREEIEKAGTSLYISRMIERLPRFLKSDTDRAIANVAVCYLIREIENGENFFLDPDKASDITAGVTKIMSQYVKRDGPRHQFAEFVAYGVVEQDKRVIPSATFDALVATIDASIAPA